MTSFQQAVCVGPVFSTPGRESTEKENGNGVLPVFQMKKNQQQNCGGEATVLTLAVFRWREKGCEKSHRTL